MIAFALLLWEGAVSPPLPPPDAESLSVGGSVIETSLSGPLTVSKEAFHRWVEDAARGVTSFYGRFPVPRVRLRVRPGGRGRVGHGVTYGGASPTIRISVGERTTEADLENDWVLTHEMVHLGFPDLDDEYSWAGEGLATYVEPWARARIGSLRAEEVWRELAEGLPQGLSRSGEGGLDGTDSWGRTYWGGALFWLLADVEIREATRNRRGAEDALRGILVAGGDVRADWDLDRTLEAGDRATGTRVLEELHRKLGSRPAHVDLDALWEKLGIVRRQDQVTFDDKAPLAAIRKSISQGHAVESPDVHWTIP